MMKLGTILMGTVLFYSCTFGLNTQGYESHQSDLMTAWSTVSSQNYIVDFPCNYYESPHEFFKNGGGGCKDFATTLIYLLGREARLVAVNMYGGGHAIVEYRGLFIEPQICGLYYSRDELDILWSINYATLMIWATWFGTKDASCQNEAIFD